MIIGNKTKRISKFWYELRRRKTVRTAIGYMIVLAAVVGPASDILDGLAAPEWVLKILILILIALFPIVMICSWIFDITSSGIVVTQETEPNVKESESIRMHFPGNAKDNLGQNVSKSKVEGRRAELDQNIKVVFVPYDALLKYKQIQYEGLKSASESSQVDLLDTVDQDWVPRLGKSTLGS